MDERAETRRDGKNTNITYNGQGIVERHDYLYLEGTQCIQEVKLNSTNKLMSDWMPPSHNACISLLKFEFHTLEI